MKGNVTLLRPQHMKNPLERLTKVLGKIVNIFFLIQNHNKLILNREYRELQKDLIP